MEDIWNGLDLHKIGLSVGLRRHHHQHGLLAQLDRGPSAQRRTLTQFDAYLSLIRRGDARDRADRRRHRAWAGLGWAFMQPAFSFNACPASSSSPLFPCCRGFSLSA